MPEPAAQTVPIETPGRRPVYSMTGFARGSGQLPDGPAWTLTIKGVNHRFLDLHMRLPAGAESLELLLRRLLKELLVRGHIEVTLTVERGARREVQLDPALLAGYIAAFRRAARDHDLHQQPDLNTLLTLPGVFVAAGGNSSSGAGHHATAAAEQGGEDRALETSVLEQAPAILRAFVQMRAAEGLALVSDLQAIISRIEDRVNVVASLHQDLAQEHFERTRDRLIALLGDLAPARDRLLQEAALLADKSDVSEEIARLRMHSEQFRASLESGGELGKKLDFLLQEMNREANTLLSKMAGVPGGGSRVTELGLEIKSDIEKAREQVQNIE
jgi:uncharacterized protein (TIGR00255 family)